MKPTDARGQMVIGPDGEAAFVRDDGTLLRLDGTEYQGHDGRPVRVIPHSDKTKTVPSMVGDHHVTDQGYIIGPDGRFREDSEGRPLRLSPGEQFVAGDDGKSYIVKA